MEDPEETDFQNDDTSCHYGRNKTDIQYVNNWEGIPENILLNVVTWMVLIFLFSTLRKRAWNYGRIALVQKTEEKWTQLFYGTVDEGIGVSELGDSMSSLDSTVQLDQGFCSWLPAIFKIKDANIARKCGPDAIQYLQFQKHIILYVAILTLISLVVVLPINFQGDMQGDETTFGHTTLSNLRPDSPLLWTHVTLAILFLPLGIIIMRRFSVNIKVTEREGQRRSRTLMITNIPRKHCDKDDLLRHFREAYPEVHIHDLQLAFDVGKVSSLERERSDAFEAKTYCENYLKSTGIRLGMQPYLCGNICSCWNLCGYPTVDALEHYVEEEHRLCEKVESERMAALKKPLGIAFVTFMSVEAAKMVYRHHRTTLGCGHDPPPSSLSATLKPGRWHVSFAPSPDDIYWENLSMPSKYWYLKAVTINAVLFIVLFFLTTPAYIVSLLDVLNLDGKIRKTSPLLSEFLPALMMVSVAALLPVLVAFSDQWLTHWTRSERNHSIMVKTFAFLLFMVLILPSLGLTSAKTFVDWAIHAKNESYRWECLFLPDKGAFFVNYVTTAAFIGTSLELIRFPELFMYAFRLCLARSKAELPSVRKAILWEFPFGVQYAWMLLIFAMTMVYCLSCPLITPFALIYMILKHLVDKHNLYFVYGPSNISQRIHATAINIVIVSIVMLQASFLALAVLRKGLNDISIYSLTGFVITILFFIAHWMFHCCRGFSPIAYQPNSSSQSTPSREPTTNHHFVPHVLESGVSPSPSRIAVSSRTKLSAQGQPELVTVHNVAEDLSRIQQACAEEFGDGEIHVHMPSSSSGPQARQMEIDVDGTSTDV
ncbi:CSC1-like protein 1 [Frankliniella fusca]|uniref:CSC1-like protein 1 n=1 Tax=Frankliniella fusca TaxID=407009 RepID=A0AAE1H0V6_9NEOP|nr:CSC1-like protein 1 [Frankliniella fusca]